jgi:hypothetical protein
VEECLQLLSGCQPNIFAASGKLQDFFGVPLIEYVKTI